MVQHHGSCTTTPGFALQKLQRSRRYPDKGIPICVYMFLYRSMWTLPYRSPETHSTGARPKVKVQFSSWPYYLELCVCVCTLLSPWETRVAFPEGKPVVTATLHNLNSWASVGRIVTWPTTGCDQLPAEQKRHNNQCFHPSQNITSFNLKPFNPFPVSLYNILLGVWLCVCSMPLQVDVHDLIVVCTATPALRHPPCCCVSRQLRLID